MPKKKKTKSKLKTPIMAEKGVARKKRTQEDAALIARAVRAGWPIPASKRPEVIARVLKAATNKREDLDTTAMALRAAQVLVTMDAQNQTDYWNHDKNTRLDTGKLTERQAVDAVVLRQAIAPPGDTHAD